MFVSLPILDVTQADEHDAAWRLELAPTHRLNWLPTLEHAAPLDESPAPVLGTKSARIERSQR